MDKIQLINLIQQAQAAGIVAGQQAVSQGLDRDLCGFAYCFVSTKVWSRRKSIFKEIEAMGLISYWDYEKAYKININSSSQSISVRAAQVEAVRQVLAAAGVESYIVERLD